MGRAMRRFYETDPGRVSMATKDRLTTNAGAPVPDNQNVLTAGPRGPLASRRLVLGEACAL